MAFSEAQIASSTDASLLGMESWPNDCIGLLYGSWQDCRYKKFAEVSDREILGRDYGSSGAVNCGGKSMKTCGHLAGYHVQHSLGDGLGRNRASGSANPPRTLSPLPPKIPVPKSRRLLHQAPTTNDDTEPQFHPVCPPSRMNLARFSCLELTRAAGQSQWVPSSTSRSCRSASSRMCCGSSSESAAGKYVEHRNSTGKRMAEVISLWAPAQGRLTRPPDTR